ETGLLHNSPTPGRCPAGAHSMSQRRSHPTSYWRLDHPHSPGDRAPTHFFPNPGEAPWELTLGANDGGTRQAIGALTTPVRPETGLLHNSSQTWARPRGSSLCERTTAAPDKLLAP